MNSMLLNLIPKELINRPQWVCWRYETREGKTTKVPYRADGKGRADSTNAATWGNFETAVQAKGFDGIGFVVTFPYCGIDIDHCRDPETGILSEEAVSIVARMKSYTEITPSNAGIRVWLKGKLPEGHNRKENIELYDTERYFTITGNHIEGTPTTIEERQAELTALYKEMFPKVEAPKPNSGGYRPVDVADNELINKAKSAANGVAFAKLWDGDTSSHNGDDSAADLALCCHLAFWTGNDGARIDTLFRQSGLYREKWEKRLDYRERTIKKAIESTRETYNPHKGNGHEPAAALSDTKQQDSPKVEETDKELSFEFNDVGNAKRLVKLFGDRLRYNWRRGRWLVWNGDYWKWDDGDQIIRLAIKAAATFYEDAAKAETGEAQKALATHARKTRNYSRLQSMASTASADKLVSIELSALDANPWLFNCINGAIDLRTGKFRNHEKEDYATVIAPVTYNKVAVPDLWKVFLERIFDGNQPLISYLQKIAGMSLTGDRTEEIVPFLYGAGQNGKSTFIFVLNNLLGDYAYTINAETLMMQKNGSAGGSTNDELANLNGKRAVFAREIQKGSRLNESEIKSMTGGEDMNVARKYEHNIEFAPIFKLWMSGNYRPRIYDTTQGTWRRIKLIPFEVTIPDAEKNPYLKYDLTSPDSLSGVLNWLIDGCLKWQAEGLVEPPEVIDATNDYRKKEDDLLEFLEECCQYSPTKIVGKTKLYEAYGVWCQNNEREPLERKVFNRRFEERGHVKECRGTGGERSWLGLHLIIDSDKSDKSDMFSEKSLHEGNQAKSLENDVTNVTFVTNPEPPEEVSALWPPTPIGVCPSCGNEDGATLDFSVNPHVWRCKKCGGERA